VRRDVTGFVLGNRLGFNGRIRSSNKAKQSSNVFAESRNISGMPWRDLCFDLDFKGLPLTCSVVKPHKGSLDERRAEARSSRTTILVTICPGDIGAAALQGWIRLRQFRRNIRCKSFDVVNEQLAWNNWLASEPPNLNSENRNG